MDENGCIMFVVVVLLAIFIFGFPAYIIGEGFGKKHERYRMQKEAISNRVARFEITNDTEKIFVWNTVTNR